MIVLDQLPDALRLAGLPLLAWAGYTDWKHRLIHAAVWRAIAALGLVALGVDIWHRGPAGPLLETGQALLVTFALALVLAWSNVGLADVKGVAVLGLWLPRPVLDIGLDLGAWFPLAVVYLAAVVGLLLTVPDRLRGGDAGWVRADSVPYVTALALSVGGVTAYGVIA